MSSPTYPRASTEQARIRTERPQTSSQETLAFISNTTPTSQTPTPTSLSTLNIEQSNSVFLNLQGNCFLTFLSKGCYHTVVSPVKTFSFSSLFCLPAPQPSALQRVPSPPAGSSAEVRRASPALLAALLYHRRTSEAWYSLELLGKNVPCRNKLVCFVKI